MSNAIEFKGIEMDRDEMPVRARKGKGVPHYMPVQPVMIGSTTVVALCSVQLGASDDDAFSEGDTVPADAPVCKRCAAIWQAALTAERERRAAKVAARLAKRAAGKAAHDAAVSAERERLAAQDAKRAGETPVSVATVPAPVTKRAAAMAAHKKVREVRKALRVKAGQRDHAYFASTVEGATLVAESVGAESDGVTVAIRRVYLSRIGKVWHARESQSVSSVAQTASGTTPDAAVSALVAGVLSGKIAKRDADAKAAEDKRAEEKREAAVAPVAKVIAGLTDGKCAAEIPDVPAEDGTPRTKLVTLSGRMDLGNVTPIAELLGVDVIPVGKSAGALPARAGTDGDGVHGVCPLCRNQIKLTNSGAVGTHRPGNVSPDGPMLSGTEVDTVTHGGSGGATPRESSNARKAVRKTTEGSGFSAAKAVSGGPRTMVRADMGVAYIAGTEEIVKAVVADDGTVTVDITPAVAKSSKSDAPVRKAGEPLTVTGAERASRGKKAVVPRASMAPKGVRDDGMSDGVAMLPLGESGYAGQKFDDESGVGVVSVVGKEEWNGALIGSEYHKLGKTAKRRYWKKVAIAREKRLAGSRDVTAKEVAMGTRVTSKVAAATRRSNGKTRQAVKEQANARGKRVGALDMADSPRTVHANSGAPDMTVYGTDGSERAGKGDTGLKVWMAGSV